MFLYLFPMILSLLLLLLLLLLVVLVWWIYSWKRFQDACFSFAKKQNSNCSCVLHWRAHHECPESHIWTPSVISSTTSRSFLSGWNEQKKKKPTITNPNPNPRWQPHVASKKKTNKQPNPFLSHFTSFFFFIFFFLFKKKNNNKNRLLLMWPRVEILFTHQMSHLLFLACPSHRYHPLNPQLALLVPLPAKEEGDLWSLKQDWRIKGYLVVSELRFHLSSRNWLWRRAPEMER